MKNQRGAVTAEAAVVLPVLTAFAVALVFLINLGIVQVRSMDAAREAARSVARGDSIAKARSVAQRVAVAGAAVRIMKGAKTVKVQVSTPVSGPGGRAIEGDRLHGGQRLPLRPGHSREVVARKPG